MPVKDRPRQKRFFLSTAVGAGLVCGAVLAAQVASEVREPDLRVDVGLVNAAFSVRNADGAFVRNLTREDFEVLEDGVPQPIRFFGATADLPLTVGLVEDFSPSQDRFNRRHREDTAAFLRGVLRRSDQAFLVCFGDYVRLVADLSGDADEMERLMREYDHHPGRFPILGFPEKRFGGTALFDAVYFASYSKMRHLSGRKALLVFSDGEDNASLRTLSTAVETAQSADALIYGVRYTAIKKELTPRNLRGIAVMKRLALETGGVDFDAGEVEMPEVFTRIGEELRSLYELGYTPPNAARDGRFHKIEIRAKRPGLTVRSRTGYFAR